MSGPVEPVAYGPDTTGSLDSLLRAIDGLSSVMRYATPAERLILRAARDVIELGGATLGRESEPITSPPTEGTPG